MGIRLFSVAGALSVPAVALVLCGVAHAGSPDVVGQKYGDASGTLGDAGFTPVVSTAVGDQEPESNCVVVRQQDRTVQPAANSSGSATNETLLSLNCDEAVATATKPGNSLESPEGRAAAAAAKAAAAKAAAAKTGVVKTGPANASATPTPEAIPTS